MKAFIRVLGLFVFVVMLLAMAPVALAADSPPAPTIPAVVEAAISLFVTWAVVNGIKALGDWRHVDFSPYASIVIVGVTGMIIYNLNSILAILVVINPDLAPIIGYVFQIAVILLGAAGVKRAELKSRPLQIDAKLVQGVSLQGVPPQAYDPQGTYRKG
jgi:hypothetical protein